MYFLYICLYYFFILFMFFVLKFILSILIFIYFIIIDNSIPLQPKVKDEFKSGYVKYRNSYYKYVEDLKTWQEAEVFCQSEGGHLVSVLNVYEEAFLYLLNNSDIEEFWMGATHKNVRFVCSLYKEKKYRFQGLRHLNIIHKFHFGLQ